MEEQILNIIKEPLTDMGFNVVRLRIERPSNKKILEILLEKLDETNISIGECAKASRHISALLDVEDIIKGKYNLEVSSAGIERPLVKKEDFNRFKNRIVQVKLYNPHEEKKKLKGNLLGIDDEALVSIEVGQKVLKFEFSNIKDAKLVLTDELYRQLIKKQKVEQ